MDFIFIKSSKAGKEDYGSVYARVRTGKANMKVVTGFTIKQLEWEKYRSLQYTSSALMSSIGIKYGQFAQVLARIKAAFEADGFNPKEAKNIIESVKHDVLNGMMQIVEVKPKGRMLFDDFLTSYIEDMETGRTENLTANFVATYAKRWGDHDFKAMAGSSLEKSEYEYY